jgi:hypothetical protein
MKELFYRKLPHTFTADCVVGLTLRWEFINVALHYSWKRYLTNLKQSLGST